jgi:hypothetical protein
MDILYIYNYAKLFSEHGSSTEVAIDTKEQDREKSNQVEVPHQLQCPTSLENGQRWTAS